MRKILFFVSPFILALIIFAIFLFFINRASGKGALQVTSLPKSNVYLNEKLIGQTPLCKCEAKDMLGEGEYTIRLAPLEDSFTPFEEKIKINKSVLTVVDRTFEKAASSEGSVITLDKIDQAKVVEILMISFPDKAQVLLDKSVVGETPVLLKNITASDHEITIVKKGYKEKTVRIRTVLGFRLTTTAFLGVDTTLHEPSITASVSATPTPTLTVTQVQILKTPTGFLRVRQDASVGSLEIARVAPSETYELVDEKKGWYRIRLKDGKLGWISAQYAQKQ